MSRHPGIARTPDQTGATGENELIDKQVIDPAVAQTAKDVLSTVERERITFFPGSPTIFTGLMAHPDFPRRSGALRIPGYCARRAEQRREPVLHTP